MYSRPIFLLVLSGLLASCASYKQNIMFKPGENFVPEPLKAQALKAEHNYVIQKNDLLLLEVYSNNGEKLVDPNPELTQTQGSSIQKSDINYLVDINGVVKFPMIGEIKVEGLTLREAEMLAQKEYANYFKTPFVILKYNNKRVIILGSPGGQVLPLTNDNISLAEAIALAKGIGIDGKAHNIRVLREDKVFLVDFSTIEGYKSGNMIIEPGDIVYVEPVRRPLAEGASDYRMLLTMAISAITLITVLTR
jgi:polysaccharide export outer membrane protein